MEKIFKKTVCTLFCIVLLGGFLYIPGTKAFTDVTSLNKYFTALEYLGNKGVIQGYPDGSFQPFKNVSRAEFLKIALSASKISVNGPFQPTGFPDVHEKSWYAPFVQKAKKEGWITGYVDGTFKPEQAITKVEALKIIGSIQNWKTSQNIAKAPFSDTPLLAWYTPYVTYAKNKNFLEEKGPLFEGNTSITRGEVSEILFRTAITQEKKVTAFSPQLIEKKISSPLVVTPPSSIAGIEPEPEMSLTFEPIAFQTLSQNFFTDVQLTENFPNTFYLHEVYFFEGKIKNPGAKKIFIFLAPPEHNQAPLQPGNFIEYSATPANDNSFKIPVIFRKPGNYQLGLIVGNSGTSRVINISVLPSLPNLNSSSNAQTLKPPTIQFHNDKTTVSWDKLPQQFFKISFYQKTNQQFFYFRQPINSFDLDFEDFENFKEGNINMAIQSASTAKEDKLSFTSGWSDNKSSSFTATYHATTLNKTQSFNSLQIPEVLKNVSAIEVLGNANKDILSQGEVIKPDGQVETVPLETISATKQSQGQEIIPANSSFNFHYVPKSSGIYIIEINDSSGEAVINTPIYVQTGIPLIPDFFDLYHPQKTDKPINLVSVREELLYLINKERAKQNLNPVSQKNDLNNLAQTQAEDMKKRNFFGHINPDNKNPEDRRKEAGIMTVVGENLALAADLLYAHEGLMRSAGHRKNILNPEWQNVGLGITQNSNSILVAEEFAPKQLTLADVENLKKDIIQQINKAKIQEGLSALTENEFLNNKGQQWADTMANENFFSFTSPNGEKLSSFFSNFPSIVQAYIIPSGSPKGIIKKIIENKEIINSTWNMVGIGLSIDKTGLLTGTLLFTRN